MLNLISREPVMAQGVIQAGLALVVAFGTTLESEQIAAILAFSAALLSFAARTRVTPLADPRSDDGATLIRSRDRPAGMGGAAAAVL